MEPTIATRGRQGALDGVLADEDAFRAWYDAALPVVYGYLLARCGHDTALAEELTQQAFVDAIRSQHRSSSDDPVAWVIGIARHRLVDHYRARDRRDRRFLRLLSRTPVQVTWLGGDGPDVDLAAGLDRLPAAQRLAVCLRYLDDLPVREVAMILDRSEGAVESLLSRGRDTLRQTMGAPR
jgi:RNA polymerase sigma-70 factor, ECF subfamily